MAELATTKVKAPLAAIFGLRDHHIAKEKARACALRATALIKNSTWKSIFCSIQVDYAFGRIIRNMLIKKSRLSDLSLYTAEDVFAEGTE